MLKTVDAAIGVFDSGVGGLTVLRPLAESFPHHPILYFADQAHVPYGPRSVAEIRYFSEEITRFLLQQGVQIIVVACNTATAAALTYLRDIFPDVPFVGMEPAVKPAAVLTKTANVGVLATPTTFASPRYSSLMQRFAAEVTVFEDPCVGLVELIEAGQLQSEETRRLLSAVVTPMLQADVDTLVLGCTHYPLVLPLLNSLTAGHEVTIIDPAPAVARQVGRLLPPTKPQPDDPGVVRLFTSADRGTLGPLAAHVLGEPYVACEISWQDSAQGPAKLSGL